MYLLDSPYANARPTNRLIADGNDVGFSRRTLERARAKLHLDRIPPDRVREQIGDEASLDDAELRAWCVALPDLPPRRTGDRRYVRQVRHIRQRFRPRGPPLS